MTTATETRSKNFIAAKCENLVLTLKPPRKLKNSDGDVYREIPGVKIEFEGRFATVEEDPYGRVLVNSKVIDADVTEPDGSEHPVTYEWVVDRLLGNEEKRIPPHRNLNKGTEHDAFYLDEPEPEIEPKLSDQLAAITRAAVDRDVERINELIALEQETHNRESVLIQGRAALEQIAEESE